MTSGLGPQPVTLAMGRTSTPSGGSTPSATTVRPSVTVAAGILQKAGFIQYSRGRVTILDRRGLERSSCECYAASWDSYHRQLGL